MRCWLHGSGKSVNSPPLLEPEGLLPCLQDPVTRPHPEPDVSNAHSNIPFILRFSLILSFHLRLSLPTCLSFKIFQQQFGINFLSHPCVLHCLSIVSSLIWSPYTVTKKLLMWEFVVTHPVVNCFESLVQKKCSSLKQLTCLSFFYFGREIALPPKVC